MDTNVFLFLGWWREYNFIQVGTSSAAHWLHLVWMYALEWDWSGDYSSDILRSLCIGFPNSCSIFHDFPWTVCKCSLVSSWAPYTFSILFYSICTCTGQRTILRTWYSPATLWGSRTRTQAFGAEHVSLSCELPWRHHVSHLNSSQFPCNVCHHYFYLSQMIASNLLLWISLLLLLCVHWYI